MRRALLLPLAVVAASCSQPVGGTGPAPTGVALATAPASPAALAPAGAAGAKSWDDRDFSVPTEKFTEAERNFEAARKAILAGYYRDSLTEDDLYRAAVAGMLERADPDMHKWNKLLSPSDVAELRRDLQGELVGVGVKIDLDPATGYIDVKGTIPGSPAERAGIAAPDKIVTVNGRLYKGLTLRDVVADIRGKAGETITLSILRGDKLVSVPVVRDKIVYDVVRDLVVGDGVGYVRIPGFNAKTPAALHDALADLAARKVRALVLDLRDNQGGSFDDAVAAAGQMVPAGSTVVSLDKRGKIEPVVARTTPVLLDLPVAVLVNHETASSAELVTAALHDLRQATVVGSRTHGKWTVQTLDDLPNGYAIKYTIAMFLTPGGKNYEGTGMAPDVEVDTPSEDSSRLEEVTDPGKRLAEDVQLRTAVAVLGRGR